MRRPSFPRNAPDKFDSGLYLRGSLSRLYVSLLNSSFETQSGNEIDKAPQRKWVFNRISSAVSIVNIVSLRPPLNLLLQGGKGKGGVDEKNARRSKK